MSLYGRTSERRWAVAGRAVQLVEWARTHRYCGRCGTPTEAVPGERARRCPACRLLAFPRLAPAMIVLIERGDEVLLARGIQFPVPMYSCLAGFVEPGESLEEAVAREVREEVGLDVTDVRYQSSQPWPFPHSLMLGFRATWAGGEIEIDPAEIVDAGWYRADDLPTIPPPMSIARRLIDGWLAERALIRAARVRARVSADRWAAIASAHRRASVCGGVDLDVVDHAAVDDLGLERRLTDHPVAPRPLPSRQLVERAVDADPEHVERAEGLPESLLRVGAAEEHVVDHHAATGRRHRGQAPVPPAFDQPEPVADRDRAVGPEVQTLAGAAEGGRHRPDEGVDAEGQPRLGEQHVLQRPGDRALPRARPTVEDDHRDGHARRGYRSLPADRSGGRVATLGGTGPLCGGCAMTMNTAERDQLESDQVSRSVADDDLLADEALDALALAADPDVTIPADAVSLWDLDADRSGLLPAWYMPTPNAGPSTASATTGWRRRAIVLTFVLALVLINAAGLCVTYGRVVLA